MGLLDGLLGGIVGGGMASVVNDLLEKHGGVGGIAKQFQEQGMGNTIKSWISTGPNLPITPEQIQRTIGPETMASLAGKIGMTPEELSAKLSTVLPEVVDKLTPGGVLPAGK
jgi:uncharacterized protein YidB (DUF937 family)